MDKENVYYATGKRKSAIARTWIMPGNGKITVNDRPMEKPGLPVVVCQGKPVPFGMASPRL